jgi:hypothetical protein
MASPTADLENMQLAMLYKQLAVAQSALKEAEGENERLREQVGG